MMLEILLLVVAVVLILLSLLQGGKSDGLSAFTGSGDLGLFANIKERGGELFISRLTLGLGLVFLIICFVMGF